MGVLVLAKKHQTQKSISHSLTLEQSQPVLDNDHILVKAIL